jgi:hypothetical protein
MYGFHPDTTHQVAISEAAELRRAAGLRRQRRRSPRLRHWFGAGHTS